MRFVRRRAAELVELAPTSMALRGDADFVLYVKKRLLGRPVAEGDIVRVPILGRDVPLAVVATRPAGTVVITEDTELIVREEPVELGRQGDAGD